MSDFLKILVERNKDFIKINEYKKLFASDAPKESFTFRINPISKLVVEKNAELLDISTGQFINILIDEFVNQIEKSQNKDAENLLLINNRELIFRLSTILNNHNLNKSESFQLLSNFGIELNDLMDKYQLLKKLNSERLRKICHVFNVSMEWLFGFSTNIYSIIPINGKVNTFVEYLLKDINKNDDKNKIYFIFNKDKNKSFILYEVGVVTNSVKHKKYMIFEMLDWNDDTSIYSPEKYMRICMELEKKGLLICYYIEFDNDYFSRVSTGIEFINHNYLTVAIPWEDRNNNLKLSNEWKKVDNVFLDNELIEHIEKLILKGASNE